MLGGWKTLDCYFHLSPSIQRCHLSGFPQFTQVGSPLLALCAGNPLVTSGFPAQKTSYIESMSISWCGRAWGMKNLFIVIFISHRVYRISWLLFSSLTEYTESLDCYFHLSPSIQNLLIVIFISHRVYRISWLLFSSLTEYTESLDCYFHLSPSIQNLLIVIFISHRVYRISWLLFSSLTEYTESLDCYFHLSPSIQSCHLSGFP